MAVLDVRRLVLFYIAPNGTTIENLVNVNARSPIQFRMQESTDLKDQAKRTLPTTEVFSCKYKDYGGGPIDRPTWFHYLELAKKGAIQAEILEGKISNNVYNGVYRLNPIGVKPKLVWTENERYIDVSLDSKLSVDSARTIRNAAQTNTFLTIPSVPEVEFSVGNLRRPDLQSIQLAGVIFNLQEIKSYKVEIEAIGTENYMKIQTADYLKVNIEITLTPYAKDKIKALFDIEKYPAFIINSGVNGSGYESHSFAQNRLSIDRDALIAEDKNEPKIILSGEIPINSSSYSNPDNTRNIFSYGN